MFKFLQALISSKGRNTDAPTTPASTEFAAPDEVTVAGSAPFRIAEHLGRHQGFPILDWDAVWRWSDQIASLDGRKMAWAACERAWLQHFRVSLGPQYRLAESGESVLLSTLETNAANATLGYMERTRKRILQVLDGVAQVPDLGKDILIVFDDEDNYYRYVSYYYPEGGEYAFSGGMHISTGCSHFVTVKADLRSIEPVIAHEMTHGCVAHLPLPRWLDEGLAVNTERRLADSGRAQYTPQQMHEKHLVFWGDTEVQQFWSGESFFRADDGNLLSYDLARIMVEQMAKDWEQFKRFVLAADRADAGALAAREQLGVELDGYVCALLGREPSSAWVPNPAMWKDDAER